MTKSQFIECAIRAGVVDAIAIEDAEAYDGGRTLHELSVMWTAVCELLGNDPTPPAETEPRDRCIPAVIERLRFGSADGDDDDIAAAEIERQQSELAGLREIIRGYVRTKLAGRGENVGYWLELQGIAKGESPAEPECEHDMLKDGHTITVTHDLRDGMESVSVARCRVCRQEWRHPLNRRGES